MKKYLVYPLFLLGLVSCKVEIEPIRYGEDACHHCAMTIVDKAYAAQAVSAKGKQYKYDAIECMVHDQLENPNEMAIQQVANYFRPDAMIKVDHALFIMNDSISSPMGEHLAAIPREHPVAVKNAPDLLGWKALAALFGEPTLTSIH